MNLLCDWFQLESAITLRETGNRNEHKVDAKSAKDYSPPYFSFLVSCFLFDIQHPPNPPSKGDFIIPCFRQ
jgi:hypothetical protein